MPDEAFSVHVDIDSLRVTPSRAGPRVEGAVQVLMSGRPFPGPRWLDYPVAILAGWLPATTRFVTGSEPTEELWFLDGSYNLQLSRSGTSIQVSAVHAKPGGDEVFAAVLVDGSELVSAMRAAGQSLLSWTAENGVRNRDVDVLASELEAGASRREDD